LQSGLLKEVYEDEDHDEDDDDPEPWWEVHRVTTNSERGRQ
jgi:hypothetical protein